MCLQNTTSWILATAAALYWRVMGNTGQAMTCLRQALFFVPNEMKDIPLISLASVLQRYSMEISAYFFLKQGSVLGLGTMPTRWKSLTWRWMVIQIMS